MPAKTPSLCSNLSRRQLLSWGLVMAAANLPLARLSLAETAGTSRTAETFEITKTPAEWRALLSEASYKVLREASTERPFSSPLNDEHHNGTFSCGGCDLPLFASKTKFDSHTGWPSFYQPLPNAVATTTDHELIIARTEVHCHRCGGHLGHVFDDGPPPTGLRYCMNGVALKFTPQS